MDTVIGRDSTKGHIVNPYKFKVLKLADFDDNQKDDVEDSLQIQQDNQVQQVEELKVETPVPAAPSQPVVVPSPPDEGMLKKLDEMSGSMIKLEMQLEQQTQRFQVELENAKKLAYEQGRNDATIEYQQKDAVEVAQKMSLLAQSIEQLEQATQGYNQAIDSLKQELAKAAVDVAKEVVLVEISENSDAVALKLAKTLMEDLKDASSVKIKVNEKNYDYLEQKLSSLQNVKLIADKAVSDGGCILLSDVGNIEGDILNRYETLKKAALGD